MSTPTLPIAKAQCFEVVIQTPDRDDLAGKRFTARLIRGSRKDAFAAAAARVRAAEGLSSGTQVKLVSLRVVS